MNNNEEKTLGEVLSNNTSQDPQYRELRIEDLKQPEEAPILETPMDDILSLMDNKAEELSEGLKVVQEERIHENLALSIDYEDELIEESNEGDKSDITDHRKSKPNIKQMTDDLNIDISDTDISNLDPSEDFDLSLDKEDDDIDGTVNTTDEEQLESIRAGIKEKIQTVNKKIDLSSFTVSNKPTSIHNLFESINTKKHIVDWVLFNSGIPFSIEDFDATEIEKLNPNNSSRNRINTFKDVYGMIYEHLAGDKPKFEEWCKLISFYDVQDLYFGIYYASYGLSNIVPRVCTNNKCKKAFVDEIKDIKSMVKFEDKEAEERFNSILNKDTTFKTYAYETERIQISDTIVADFKLPSIYSVVFENNILEDKIREKYNAILKYMFYIDKLYTINHESQTLEPIEFKEFGNDFEKTVKYKLKIFTDVFKSLTPDQYTLLNVYINSIAKHANKMSYQIPEVKCPHCNTTLEAIPSNADELLFTRHQLPALTTI